jgi:hypothetical protein
MTGEWRCTNERPLAHCRTVCLCTDRPCLWQRAAFEHRPSSGLLMIPPIEHSRAVGRVRDTVLARHMEPRNAVAAHCDDGSIDGLPRMGDPCAVSGRIAFCVVPPLNRHLLVVAACQRPISERIEFAPLVCDADTFPAVVRVRGVAAPPPHVLPYLVKPGSRGSVRLGRCAKGRVSRVPAGQGFAKPKIGPLGPCLRTAGTRAEPHRRSSGVIPVLAQHGQLAKRAPCHVNESWVLCHGAIIQRRGRCSLGNI